MSKINVHLIGRPYVEVDGERINFPYKKAEGFFYYLCVKKNATREEIIYVLWGADNENVGRKNLREAVYQIKKLLGKEILVTAGHTSISLNPECMPEIDWDFITEENILEHVFALAKRHHKPVYAVVSNMSIALLRKKWIQQCACLVCNLEEAQQLFDIVLDEQSVERCIEQLVKQSLQQKIVPLVVTMGSRGAIYIESQDRYGHVCAKDVQVVDTTGCGDAFFAGVVMGLTYGQTLEQACQIGTTLASSVIQTKENVCFHVSSEQLGLQLKTK